MRRLQGIRYVCLLAVISAAAWSETVPKGLNPSDWNSIRAEYERRRLDVVRTGSEYVARNPHQQMLARFDGRGFTLEPLAGGWQWGLEIEQASRRPTRVRTDGARITYEWDNTLEEWFVNDQRGLEHGFTLKEGRLQPARGFSPALKLKVRGGLQLRIRPDQLGADFLDPTGQSVIQYAGLKVWDADGKILPARLQAEGEGLRLELDATGARYPITIDPIAQQGYLNASNAATDDEFGNSVAVSGDTVVVGAYKEDGSATGVNGTPDEGAFNSGAAYVFVRNSGVWTQQAYLKASNAGATDFFGYSVAISGDTVVVGAYQESSSSTGINSTPNDSAFQSGAAYVFVRNSGVWTEQAYLKASNTGANDNFGRSVAISGDTVVVGAHSEDSSTTGVNSTPNDSRSNSGAAYVFVRNSGAWMQQAYLKSSNTGLGDNFGDSVAISGDTVVVGAFLEDSSTTGVNTTPNEGATDSGAAYVFVRNSGAWTQQAYLKASNPGSTDRFGIAVAISGDSAVVGAYQDDSSTTGVNSTPNEGATDSGAAYVFVRNSGVWTQQAYLKASNSQSFDNFGWSVAISGDTAVVGAPKEDSSTTGVNSTPNEDGGGSGAAYVFVRNSGVWTQQAYLKASDTSFSDNFGFSVAISGDSVVVGADTAGSTASGAAYVFSGPPCGSGRNMPAGQWTMFSLPCAADAPATVSSVFSGVTGTYGTDWVVWERNETTNVYTKLSASSPLTQGNGYWFKSLNAQQFAPTGTTTPTTTSSDCPFTAGCFEITLTQPSNADGLYNLAGHPFPSNVDWANVRVVADGASAASPSQAESNGDMSKTYWVWNGSGYDSYDDVTPALIGQLQPTYGMWVKVLNPNLTSIKLLIPGGPVDVAPLSGIIKKAPLKPTEWYVRIVAEVAAEKLKDRGNVLGQLKDSTAGPDSHDLPELPPSFTPYLTVVFPGEYASDFHPVKAGVDSWKFFVRTDDPKRKVKLSWEILGKAPANMSLKDVKTGKVIQRKAGNYTFVMGAKERAFVWTVK